MHETTKCDGIGGHLLLAQPLEQAEGIMNLTSLYIFPSQPLTLDSAASSMIRNCTACTTVCTMM